MKRWQLQIGRDNFRKQRLWRNRKKEAGRKRGWGWGSDPLESRLGRVSSALLSAVSPRWQLRSLGQMPGREGCTEGHQVK